VKLLIEEIEREETALRDDLYSADRKFAEYYNVCAQTFSTGTIFLWTQTFSETPMLNLCACQRDKEFVCVVYYAL